MSSAEALERENGFRTWFKATRGEKNIIGSYVSRLKNMNTSICKADPDFVPFEEPNAFEMDPSTFEEAFKRIKESRYWIGDADNSKSTVYKAADKGTLYSGLGAYAEYLSDSNVPRKSEPEELIDVRGLIEGASKQDEPQNLVFHGAPGTGKTYNVLKACAELINGGPVEGEPLEWLNENADGRFSMVQFHPSYDYTDFVEGLRPYTTNDGNVGFKLTPGEFMKLCARARADSGNQYYMLIDEINRGDISKIFGELFFLLDPGYRGQGVSTQYANMHDTKWRTPTTDPKDGGRRVQYLDADGGFSIPRNVTIIGTMNDIDRSVDSLDFAMRRRFRFIEITAETSWNLLFGTEPDSDEYPSADRARELMAGINAAIEKTPELGPDYTLGATYFRSLAKAGDDGFESEWSETWSDRIEPLLREYLRGTGLNADAFNKWERKTTEDTDTNPTPESERKGNE